MCASLRTLTLCYDRAQKYSFIFVKMGKNGGSSVLKILKEGLCGAVTVGRFGGACPNRTVLDHGQGQRLGEVRAPCQRAMRGSSASAPSATSCAQFTNICLPNPPSRDVWASSFVFTFVRDPVARRVSAIEYCGVQGYGTKRGCDRCGAGHLHLGLENGTSRVSTHVSTCGSCSSWHCAPQHSSVLSPSGHSYVDYVGHTENLADDMVSVARRCPDTHLHEVIRGHASCRRCGDTHTSPTPVNTRSRVPPHQGSPIVVRRAHRPTQSTHRALCPTARSQEAVLRVISARSIERGEDGVLWANSSAVTKLTANVHSSAYIRSANKTPPPLACEPWECFNRTQRQTGNIYDRDLELYGLVRA